MIIVSGVTGELFIRGQLIVPGDAKASLASIRSWKALFRAGLLTDSVMLVCDVAVTVLLYVLLKPVDATLALIAMAFRLMQAAVLGANLLSYTWLLWSFCTEICKLFCRPQTG